MYPIGGPHNKEYNILGSILGSPLLGNYQIGLLPAELSCEKSMLSIVGFVQNLGLARFRT